MIFYFSGTGNSRLAAHMLAGLLGETAMEMTEAGKMLPPAGGETGQGIGLVFPVYAWGLPAAVGKFLNSAAFRPKEGTYVYMVATCGDDAGYTDRLLARILKEKGSGLAAAFTVEMPNTYVALPGFDVDAPDVARRKLEALPARIERIAQSVERRERGVCEVTRGAMPWLKTYAVRPLFNRFLTNDRHFRSNRRCTQCGACARACPLGNIRANPHGRPEWLHGCTMCLACYHACPTHAVAYGPFTRGKGQYRGPGKDGRKS